MAKAVQKIKLSPSRDIRVQQAGAGSQSNVRRIKAGISIEDLAEDISRRRKVYAAKPLRAADSPMAMARIPACSKYRLAAAAIARSNFLVKQKRLAKTAPIPCIVGDSG